MNKNSLIYTLLFSSLFSLIFISILGLQNNDIKIPQKEVVVKIDISNKFNVNLANRELPPSPNF